MIKNIAKFIWNGKNDMSMRIINKFWKFMIILIGIIM